MHSIQFVPVLLVVAVLTGCAGQELPAGGLSTEPSRVDSSPAAAPSPQARFDGTVLTLAGSSPFTGAVASSSDRRDLVLQITRLPSGASFPVCTGVRWKPVVSESARAVSITLAAYAPRDGSGRCVDGLDAPVPFPVSLSAPLGSRQLVDGSDGTVHRVFGSASMPLPALSSLPTGVTAGPIHWDETARVASRRWQSADTSPTAYQDVWISIGPSAGITAGAPVPSRTVRTVEVGGVHGRLWHGGGPYDVVVIRFPRGDDVVEVRTVQDKARRNTSDQALRIAQGLR